MGNYLDEGSVEDPRLAAMRRAAEAAAAGSFDPSAPMGPVGPGPGTSNGAFSTVGSSMGPRDPENPYNAQTYAPTATYAQSSDPNSQPVGPAAPAGPAAPDAVERALSAARASGVIPSAPTTQQPTAPTITPQQAATGGSIVTAFTKPPTLPGGSTTTTTTGGGGNVDYGKLLSHPESSAGAGATTTAGSGGGAGTGGGFGPAGAGPITNQNTGPQGGSGGSDLGSITNQLMSQIQTIGSTLANPGTPTDVTGVFLTQANSILALLDQQEADLRAESEKNGTQVDPSTAFTISKLRENLQENLKTVREDLNRRGLNDSGIQLELENKLRTGSQSDESRIMAERLTSLQQQLTQGLSANRASRVNTLTSFGRGAAEAQTSHNENQYKSADDREQAALSAMLGLRGQANQSDISQRQLAQQSSESALQRAFDSSQSQAKYANELSLANLNNDSAMARALASAKGGGSGSGVSAPAQINNPYGGSTKTGSNVDAGSTNSAIAAIGNATSRTQAITDLANAAPALIAQGVDVQAVSDAIDAQFPESQESLRGRRTVGGPI